MKLKEQMLQMLASLLPLKKLTHRRFAPHDACRRCARGNVNIAIGRVMFDDDVKNMRNEIDKYAF